MATRTERKPPVPVADAIVRHDRKRVLVVDDNHDAADMLAIMLEHADYESRQAHDGKSALAAALAWGPDIVILDIGLPDVSGYEVARQLREDSRFQKLELIALSGWGTEDDKRKAVAAGFNRHFTKPVDAGALCAALARSSAR